jgi:hypothetical protein
METTSPSLVASVVRCLNDPAIKKRIKSITGTISFTFSTAVIIDIYQTLQMPQMRRTTIEFPHCSPDWVQMADKIITHSAKLSLILSAMVSQIGSSGISALVGRIMSKTQQEKVFGKNTTFAVNPWHPRHLVSIAAVLLALPSVNRSAYASINWSIKKVWGYSDGPLDHTCINTFWLSDSHVRLMVLFNTFTSRPVLHLGNLYCRKFISKHI